MKAATRREAFLLGILAGVLFASTATAQTKDCQSVYNPHTRQWEYQCVERERERGDYRPPVCRQEYDAMNRVWVTVCE